MFYQERDDTGVPIEIRLLMESSQNAVLGSKIEQSFHVAIRESGEKLPQQQPPA